MAYSTDQRAKAITATGTVGEFRYELVNATAGAITRNLIAAADSLYHTFSFIKTDSGANTVTIDGNGAETINGAATIVLSSQYESVTITCNGTAWYIVA